MATMDYRNWDWLPKAANEIERYLERLLAEAAVTAHAVSARPKSITSFLDKCDRKKYPDPMQEVTDIVAVRIITYSVTDRDRATQLIQDRFTVKQEHNPGDAKPTQRRGYDCQHLIVTGESSTADPGWMIAGGKLSQYFTTFGGLEIQIRTVAAHAWAEFEHSRRYKGQPYQAISNQDRTTINQLFGAASDARRALDETFVAIDMLLANPTSLTASSIRAGGSRDGGLEDGLATENVHEDSLTRVEASTLRDYLAERFPDDEEASERGMQFACELVNACGLNSIEALSDTLDTIDGDDVRRLMDTPTSVTRVRRLDDELLAKFGEAFIKATGALGTVEKRGQQLEWRYDRVRNKVSTFRYNTYTLGGGDCPEELRAATMPAARVVRELAHVVAHHKGSAKTRIPNAVSETPDDLPPSARARRVPLSDGESLWVATNLSRKSSEALMRQLLQLAEGLDLHVMKDDHELASAP